MKKKKFGITELLQLILFMITLFVFIFSLYKVVTITLEYKESRDEYKKLEQFVQVEETELLPVEPKTEPQEGEEAVAASTESASKEISLRYHDGFVNMTVDFAALKSMNPDFAGWLYIPGASISYPMVLTEDNDYYLTHTFQQEENKSGAIFIDQAVINPFEEYNTIVHGHNMKDLSMFGRLKTFYNDTEAYARNPYFYVYTEEKTYKYLICSYYITTDTSDAYVLPYTEETYAQYRATVLNHAVYKDVEGIPENAPFVTLSTCYGANYTEKRLVVHGILVATQ